MRTHIKGTPKSALLALWEGVKNPPVTGEFPTQRASNRGKVSAMLTSSCIFTYLSRFLPPTDAWLNNFSSFFVRPSVTCCGATNFEIVRSRRKFVMGVTSHGTLLWILLPVPMAQQSPIGRGVRFRQIPTTPVHWKRERREYWLIGWLIDWLIDWLFIYLFIYSLFIYISSIYLFIIYLYIIYLFIRSLIYFFIYSFIIYLFIYPFIYL